MVKLWLAVLLGLAVVAGAVTVLAPQGDAEIVVDMDWTVDDPCPDGVIIGAAGSGQRDDAFGVGPQVLAALSGFSIQLSQQPASGISVGFIALDYPAPGLLDGGLFGFLGNGLSDSIAQGREILESLLESINERCGEAKVYLIGYSQGASVVHTAVADLPEAYRDAIGGVALISNPNRDADDPNTQHLTTDLDPAREGDVTPHTRDGVFNGLASPVWLNGSLYSACARRDAVCNFALVDLLVANVFHTDEAYHGLSAELGRLLAEDLMTRR